MQGQRVTNVEKEEITVMVGRDQCVVEAIADTVITCYAPQRDEPVFESVTVRTRSTQSKLCNHNISGVIWTEYQQQRRSA